MRIISSLFIIACLLSLMDESVIVILSGHTREADTVVYQGTACSVFRLIYDLLAYYSFECWIHIDRQTPENDEV